MSLVEYEHEVVPQSARRSLFSVAAVWIAYPLGLPQTIIGAMLVLSMGFQRAVFAIFLGNLIQLFYCGLLGMLGQKRGMNFALQSSVTFGQKGFPIITSILALTLMGWVGVEIAMTGQMLHHAFHVNYLLMVLVFSAFIFLTVFFGIKGLHWLSVVATPAFVCTSAYVLWNIMSAHSWPHIWHFPAASHGGQHLLFGAGVAMAYAMFVDGCTVNADYCRWAKTKTASWVACLCAFPFANMLAMLVGGVIAAALSQVGANVFHSHTLVTYLAAQHQIWISVLAVLFVYITMGSVTTHTLYNSAMEWSHVFKRHYRTMVVIVSILAMVLALSGIWHYLDQWLNFLGIAIPPIGAVIIMDQCWLRRNAEVENPCRYRAFGGVIIGMIVGSLIGHFHPGWVDALWSLGGAAIGYAVLHIGLGRHTTQRSVSE